MKIVINQSSTHADWDLNLSRFEAVLNSYRNTDVDYILSPELFLTGADFSKKALKFNQKSLQLILKYCRDNKIGCMAGFLTDAKNVQKPYRNSLIIIDSKGIVVNKYDKNNLISAFNEPKYLQAGSRGVIINQKLSQNKVKEKFSIGLSICYDLRFPELYRKYAKKEIHCLLVIAAWPVSRAEQMITLAKARAIENQCYLLLVNSCSNQPEPMAGHSMLINALGEIMINLDAGEKTKVIDLSQEVDLAELQKYRIDFNALYQYIGK